MLLEITNFLALVTMFVWAAYFAHVTDSLIKRFAFVGIMLAITMMLIFLVIPYDNMYYQRQLLWQPVLLRFFMAIYCLNTLWCEIGSRRFIEAFKNNKQRFIHLTDNANNNAHIQGFAKTKYKEK